MKNIIDNEIKKFIKKSQKCFHKKHNKKRVNKNSFNKNILS